MYEFHVSVHALTEPARRSGTLHANGHKFHTLAVSQDSLDARFAVSFEQTAETLSALPRMFLEPDGSFVWVSPADERNAWQVDGHLYDRSGRLLYVDLKGRCPPAQFDQILQTLGWPHTPVVFQIVQAAVYLDEQEFRHWATPR